MSENSPERRRDLRKIDRVSSARAAAGLGEPFVEPRPNIYNSRGDSQQENIGERPASSGRQPTRERVRFTWALFQLEKRGFSQVEIARRTGITTSYLNALRNPDRGGNLGIGAEIVRRMHEGLGIDPAYFFDAYEGERPIELYSINKLRQRRHETETKSELAELRAEVHRLATLVSELRDARV
jgi:transcriptional regulator with XRE-family HTH domain